mmetsp:Transcript_24083/g.61528  ORF Transcript_24083/g.61528 Transcript_24083/m.61528 type:complete len:99 (-) Transcript_24083:593-889(-)
MGFFTSSRKKKQSVESNQGSPGTTTVPAKGGTVDINKLNMEKAATKIESQYRGKVARYNTKGLMASRDGGSEDGPLDFFAKCLPCLAPAVPSADAPKA